MRIGPNGFDGRRIRLGIIGVGDVAHRDYLPEIHRLADLAEVVAVAGRSGARAKATAERYGFPVWHCGYQALLEVDEVDAVVNLTPWPMHAEVVAAALRAGKHVYSEKPLAPSAALHSPERAADGPRRVSDSCAHRPARPRYVDLGGKFPHP